MWEQYFEWIGMSTGVQSSVGNMVPIFMNVSMASNSQMF